MIQSVEAQITYKCDVCGELHFRRRSSEPQAEAHPRSGLKDKLESRVTGTSTPAEDREEERSV
jgi:hypothetical protein